MAWRHRHRENRHLSHRLVPAAPAMLFYYFTRSTSESSRKQEETRPSHSVHCQGLRRTFYPLCHVDEWSSWTGSVEIPASPGSLNTSRLPVCSVCATATRTLTRLGTTHGSRHSGVNGFPLLLQLQMRPSLTASYRGILFFSKMALLLPRRHLTLVSTTTTPSETGDRVITGTPIQPGIKIASSSTVFLSDLLSVVFPFFFSF